MFVCDQVLVAATLNRCCSNKSSTNAVASMSTSPSVTTTLELEEGQSNNNNPAETMSTALTPTKSLKFLNTAVEKQPFHPSLNCTNQQLEEVKTVLKVLPIFACTVMLNCCLAQLSTFSVQQASTMDTRIGSLKLPPASLPVFPVLFIIVLVPLYDHVLAPFARNLTNSESGISHLQRIGVGLLLSVLAMAVAALVETKRKALAQNSTAEPLPLTFLWLAFQYLFLGSADLFTLAGLLEFFFTEAPTGMRSLATSLSWASLAVGYYLSSVIVTVVNSVTARSGHTPWLSGDNINHYHLDRFYWLMCTLTGLNFLHYLFWAIKYKYRSPAGNK